MKRFTLLAGLLVTVGLVSTGHSASADTDWSKDRNYNGHVMATSYTGKPDLGLTVALVSAGGGAANFSSMTLVQTLAGPSFPAEAQSLTARFGKRKVDAFFGTLTFAIDDALQLATVDKIALPATPSVDPKDGKVLAAALYSAGNVMGKFDPGYFFEHLISHPLHLRVMHDIDRNAAYGPINDRDFHIVLTQAMNDLKTSYGF